MASAAARLSASEYSFTIRFTAIAPCRQRLVRMDPRTTFVIATLMMLLNGGVLGLMHRDLPSQVQPSAFSWRVGTLLLAGGCILLAVQDQLPLGFILPVANGCLFLGITGYWRALRQFYGFKDTPALLLPVVIATAGIYWFSAIAPSLEIRVVLASAVWTLITFACVWTLRAGNAADSAVSRSVLAGIFLVIGSFMFLRGIYFAANGDGIQNVLDARSWLSAVTPLVAAVLPVIGTTAFLLLCSERIRRQ